MTTESFTISEVMCILDAIKIDKAKWIKMRERHHFDWDDKDVIDEYDSIISKLESRLEDYNGTRRAIQHLLKIKP